ncbi:ABC transporter [Miltoncostaea oceani]|uniref:ABC transporter n=1 Tax=Miltoncostaea oceani TaxID=2843216 RepID=UPI001C3D992A|nr:ABC transporter [Miltoncostaea oceani]
MTSPAAPDGPVAALEQARDALQRVRLGLEIAGSEEGRRVRDALVAQIDDYLLPRLRQRDAPLLMVVGGSTGAGKSTLVNSLLGAEVSAAGVLRPTTRAPVLALNPADVPWFADDRVLPGLARVTGGEVGPGTLVLAPTDALPAGLALLDSPDVDSVREENRALARQLLAAADAWLFVTTAARYADAVPWELLHAARERGTALALVLDRVPDDAGDEISVHLRAMLADRGLGDTELLVVPEAELGERGMLPDEALAPVRRWLDALAADAQARAALIQRTLAGAMGSVGPRVAAVERAVGEEDTAARRLRSEVDGAYDRAVREVDDALRGGALLRGEVLARWHEVVGTGDVMRGLESTVSRARDRIKQAFSGRRPEEEVAAAVETSVEALVRAAAERAAERATRAWHDDPAGRALGAAQAGLDGASPGLREELEREVRAWQGHVFDLVRTEGADKRSTARLASLGVNGAGLTVMLAVFVQTGGLTGAEVVVAGGTSAVGQKVLEAIFGDQAVRSLAARARDDLLTRVRAVMAAEAARFEALLEPVVATPDALAALLEARAALLRARV